jgi:Ca2+-binding RTX toxin-like protein
MGTVAFASGTVTGSFTIDGAASFTGGVETGSGTIDLKGTTTISGDVALDGGYVLQNNGTIDDTGGEIYLGYNPDGNSVGGGTIDNNVGATFELQSSSNGLYFYGDYGSTVFNNAGLLEQTAGTASSYFDVALNNTGTVDVASGTLDLADGGSSSASSLDVASGATLEFGGGTFSLTDGTFSGQGSLAVNGGTLELGSQDVSFSNFSQSGGTLSGAGTVTVTGTTNFTGGLETGAGTTVLTGDTAIAGNLYLDGGYTLENTGTVTWSAGNINLGLNPAGYSATIGGATIDNDAGATWLMTGSNTFMTNGYGINTFNNYGLFEENASGANSVQVNFNNYGQVLVLSGTVNFDGGTAAAGASFVAAPTAAVTFTNYDVGGATLSGSVGFDGTDTNSTVFVATGGETFSGTGTFVNTGTVTTSSAPMSGPTKFNVSFNNEGSVDVENGTIDIANVIAQYPGMDGNVAGPTLTGGTWIIGPAGTLLFSLAGTVDIQNNEADVTLNGAGSSFTRIDALQNNSGAFRVIGGRDFTTAGAFTNSGTLQLGGGVFSTAGAAFTAASTSTIVGYGTLQAAVANAGSIAASGGALDITGAITGAGSLAIDAGATLELGGATAEGVAFASGGTATLILDAPSDLTGAISGLILGDVIDFKGVSVSSATISGSTLSVVIGGVTHQYQIAGDITGHGFSISGGDLTLTDAVPLTPVSLTTGKDTVTAPNVLITAATKTLSSGDIIDPASGQNVLKLVGGGTFDLATPKTLADVQTLDAQEGAGGALETVTLRNGLNLAVDVASGGGAGSGIKIIGAKDSSIITLGNGTDTVTLGSASETVYGGGGADTFDVTASTIGATIDGGSGASTLIVNGGGVASMGANITDVKAVTLKAATDFTANGLNLAITGSKAADTIQAGAGAQTITGGGGADTLIAGTGADIFKDTAANLALDTIEDFAAGDTIDITNFKPSTKTATTATWANGVLTVKQGTKTETIHLAGSFAGTFTAGGDGAAGTDITYSATPGNATPEARLSVLAQAMAGFGGSNSASGAPLAFNDLSAAPTLLATHG